MQQRFGARTQKPAEPLKPVLDPAGWTKEEIARSTEWIHVMSEREIADLDRAVAKVEEGQLPLVSVGRQGFEMPVLGPSARCTARRDELCFAMDFRQGDIQFLHNHVIVHSRTSAVEDFPEPERKRHLLRLRLMTPNGRPLPNTFFAQERVDIENVQPGQRPSGSIIAPGVELKIPLEAE